MFQRRSNRTAPRSRSLALGGALAALAVVGGGTVVAVTAPSQVEVDDILLAQNGTAAQGEDSAGQDTAAQQMPLGVPVDLDLEPVVAQAAGGQIPAGTEVQVTGLPDGLVQNGWVISGTPTRAGDYDVLVTVSNGGESRSQKVALTVVDGADAAGAGAGAEGARAATDQADQTEQTDPTLSAVPGDPSAMDSRTGDGVGADGTGEGGVREDDDEVGISPDLCAALEGGQVDGASLASLLPMLAGEDDAGTTGLVMVMVNTIVNLLPSVLGEGGSLDDLGSAGQFLCTLSPSLLGQSSGEADGEGNGEGNGEGAAPEAAAAAMDGGAALDAGTVLDAAPALLGLLSNGAGNPGL